MFSLQTTDSLTQPTWNKQKSWEIQIPIRNKIMNPKLEYSAKQAKYSKLKCFLAEINNNSSAPFSKLPTYFMDFKSPVGRTYILATSSLSLYSAPIGSMSFLDFELDISINKKKAKNSICVISNSRKLSGLARRRRYVNNHSRSHNNGSLKRYQLVMLFTSTQMMV